MEPVVTLAPNRTAHVVVPDREVHVKLGGASAQTVLDLPHATVSMPVPSYGVVPVPGPPGPPFDFDLDEWGKPIINGGGPANSLGA